MKCCVLFLKTVVVAFCIPYLLRYPGSVLSEKASVSILPRPENPECLCLSWSLMSWKSWQQPTRVPATAGGLTAITKVGHDWRHWMKEKWLGTIFPFSQSSWKPQLSAKILLFVYLGGFLPPLFWVSIDKVSFLLFLWVFLWRMLNIFFFRRQLFQKWWNTVTGTEYYQGDVLCRLPLIILNICL